MNCKNCVHYEVCQAVWESYGVPKVCPSQCGYFKDKSKIIELPCKVGDRVYTFYPHLYECVVTSFEIIYGKENIYKAVCDCCGRIIGLKFTDRNIGKTVFLTKEEAEAALANYNKL